MAPADRRTLLVNFFYCAPVGHAVEALRYCLGYHRADPSLEISLVLNADTATELADLCAFVTQVYPVGHPLVDGTADPEPAVVHVPRDWDWVAPDGRSRQPGQRAAFPGMAGYYDACDRYFRVRLGTGCAGAPPPAYMPHQRLSLDLPSESRLRAQERTDRAPLVLAVMPAGSGPRWLYPSLSSWQRILEALAIQHTDAVFCLVGKHRNDERTSTSITAGERQALRYAVPGTVDCFDLPLVDQLAVVQRSRVFISPHTGFGMAALAVGTPWLTISGGRWHEFFFNGVPFYSVLPDPKRFPAYTGMGADATIVEQDLDGEGRRSLSMSADRITADLAQLLDGAGMLIGGCLSYEQAMDSHFSRVRRVRDLSTAWSIDGAHLPYV